MIYCEPTHPCGQFRLCDKCAGKRQAHIADKAAFIAKMHGDLYLSVITPHENTEAAIKQARKHLIRNQGSRAGLWTVEQGSMFGALHINLLTPYATEYTPPKCDLWEDARPADARRVAAYISKREGMPCTEVYKGNLYGTWSRVASFLATDKQLPIIQGAALNDAIRRQHPNMETNPDLHNITTDHALARQHLAYLYTILNPGKKIKSGSA